MPAISLDTHDLFLLEKKGYTPEDVAAWTYILGSPDSETVAQRFLAHDRSMPSFMLLEVLRRQDITSRTLKGLLIYCWNVLLDQPQPELIAMPERRLEDKATPGEWILRRWKSANQRREGSLPLEEISFMVMVSRLLKHARRTWPTAVISIARMVSIYLDILRDRNFRSAAEGRLHHRFTKMYNIVISRLALPSSGFPMKSMHFNWHAQRLLLERAGEFSPPLEIDQQSYRAVMSVLVASRKSENETNFARHMARTWPPWRTEQDGIDARRPLESDLSRTSGAILQLKRAGYSATSIDKAIGILGGREPDGTPTVQTRHGVAARLQRASRRIMRPLLVENDTDQWVARIRSTRDVREAWSAFLGYEEQYKTGSLAAYYAMFEKLMFEKARNLRKRTHTPLTGDGKEVISVVEDNLTEDERMRTSPPDIDHLYQRMIHASIRPSGQCLAFLVSHARTIDDGIRYLRDSDLPTESRVALLMKDTRDREEHLKRIPDATFLAFIKLLCRFAYCSSSPVKREVQSATEGLIMEGEHTSVKSILPPSANYTRLHPLLHALELLTQRKPSSRPSWYALFSALARRAIIVDMAHIGLPKNDIMSWRVLEAALKDSQRAGIEIDSKGYQILCTAFEKALVAADQLDDDEIIELDNGPTLLKDHFARLTEDFPAGNGIPHLVHVVEAATTHAHIRVFGLLRDAEELVKTVQWMVDNQDELEAIDAMAGNGKRMRRRCFIAVRSFLEGDKAEEKVRELVDSVDAWGGWPSDEEVDNYRRRDSSRTIDSGPE